MVDRNGKTMNRENESCDIQNLYMLKVYVDESHMVRSLEILIEARVENKPD